MAGPMDANAYNGMDDDRMFTASPEDQIHRGPADTGAIQSTQTNGTSVGKSLSFRERARGRPELRPPSLSLASAEDEYNAALYSPSIQSDPYDLTTKPAPATPPIESSIPLEPAPGPALQARKNSVPGRSPLQALELKLGDISKEEKRARALEAEEQMARRTSTKHSGQPGDWTSAAQTARAVTITRKPLQGVTEWLQSSNCNRVITNDDERKIPAKIPEKVRSASDESRDARSPQGSPADDTIFSGMQQGSIFASSQGRRGQYNSLRTTRPAQDAVDAIQNSRRRSSLFTIPTSPRAPAGLDGQGHSRARSSSEYQNGRSRTRSNSDGQDPQSQLQAERMGSRKGLKAALKNQAPDPLPPGDVRSGNTNGPINSVPPQTAGGQQARKRVAFGPQEPEDMGLPRHQTHGEHQHHLPRFWHHGQERRYQDRPSRDDWRYGDTAILTAQDLDLSTPEAFWEQGDASSHTQPLGTGTYSATTTFQPALNLRCGPVLRYSGIRKDAGGSKQFWRGSVMIVTDDGTSNSSSNAPVLRLFKQPMALLPSPSRQPREDDEDEESRMAEDLTAGLPKVSRTGQTLYVKPVHQIPGETDLSQIETDQGLFERTPSTTYQNSTYSRMAKEDGEKTKQFQEVKGCRLHTERGVTFWRFNIEVELNSGQNRIAYRVNKGPAVGFWVPAVGQSMNIMFHSCNGFSMSVDTNNFSGPDPLWRDVLSSHQIRPFHCMIGGGDQLYNDRVMKETEHFQNWLSLKIPTEKHGAEFSEVMQNELEQFYLDRYAMWFSQGLFGLANSQIPMINVWDDHDIIDGFGSYPHHFMSTAVFSGVGNVAFKYYMLFQHQSVPDETEAAEPSWLLGAGAGPYINQRSRSLFLSLGRGVEFLGIDCRTERMREEILSQETYDLIFDRCRRQIVQGETRHLIVLLGVPIAYPRLNFLENVLTSRAMDPFKALGHMGMLGDLVNKFDGGVEILDDLDDHWTAKHHKHERNWFIQELQELAAEKSVRITILGGDVHLAAIGQFYSNPKLGVPKDRDHRYMANVISSAIVNTPPPEMMADVLNKRNKVHHLDSETDEYMVPLFSHDVDGKKRNNNSLLPRRNWCAIRIYENDRSVQDLSSKDEDEDLPPPTKRRGSFSSLTRSFSWSRSQSRDRGEERGRPGLLKRLSSRKANPPSSYRKLSDHEQGDSDGTSFQSSASSLDGAANSSDARGRSSRRQSTDNGARRKLDLNDGLQVTLNCEIDQHDPAGFTEPYTLIIPALNCGGTADPNNANPKGGLSGLLGSLRRARTSRHQDDSEDDTPRKIDRSQISAPIPIENQFGGDGTIERQGHDNRRIKDDDPMSDDGASLGALAGAEAYPSGNEDRGSNKTPSQQFVDAPQYQHSAEENLINAASARMVPPARDSLVTGNEPSTRNENAVATATMQNPINTASQDVHHGQSTPNQAERQGSASDRAIGGDADGNMEASDSHMNQNLGSTAQSNNAYPSRQEEAIMDQSTSNAPLLSSAVYRPESKRRYSAAGPAPPKNFSDLPASVQKRYSQLNDPSQNQHLSQDQRGQQSSQANGTGQAYSHGDHKIPSRHSSEHQPSSDRRWSRELDDPEKAQRRSQSGPGPQQANSSLRGVPPPPTADDYYRRYASGPMEMPLLPVAYSQLRSSDHRTLQLVDGGETLSDTRSASGPAAYPGVRHDHASSDYVQSLPQTNDRSPYASQPTNAQFAAPTRSNTAPTSNSSTVPMSLFSRGQAKLQRKRGNTSSRSRRNSSTDAVTPMSPISPPPPGPNNIAGIHVSRDGTSASFTNPLPEPAIIHDPIPPPTAQVPNSIGGRYPRYVAQPEPETIHIKQPPPPLATRSIGGHGGSDDLVNPDDPDDPDAPLGPGDIPEHIRKLSHHMVKANYRRRGIPVSDTSCSHESIERTESELDTEDDDVFLDHEREVEEGYAPQRARIPVSRGMVPPGQPAARGGRKDMGKHLGMLEGDDDVVHLGGNRGVPVSMQSGQDIGGRKPPGRFASMVRRISGRS